MKHFKNIFFIILCINFISLFCMQDYASWDEGSIADRLRKIKEIEIINRDEVSPQLALEKKALKKEIKRRNLRKVLSEVEAIRGERKEIESEVEKNKEKQEEARRLTGEKIEALKEMKRQREIKQEEKRRKKEQEALQRERSEEEIEQREREEVVRKLKEQKEMLKRKLETALKDLYSALRAFSFKMIEFI